MFKLVVFDLDGTLIDSAGAILKIVNLTFAEIGLGPYEWDRDIARFFGKPFPVWAEALLREAGRFTKKGAREISGKFSDSYAVLGPRHARLSPGALDTLEILSKRGVRLGVATNMTKRQMDSFLSHFGLKSFFWGICTASDVNKGKPDPDQMNCILKKIRAKRTETLMVGDSETDVRFAANAGVRIALLDAAWNRGLKPDYRIGSLKELPEIVLV